MTYRFSILNAEMRALRDEKLQYFVAHVHPSSPLSEKQLQQLAPRMADHVFRKQGIPTSPVVKDKDIFIVSTSPISDDSAEIEIRHKEIECKILPSTKRTTLAPINPEELKAVTNLWYRSALINMKKSSSTPKGAKLDYDPSKGWLLRLDPSLMSIDDFPDWVPNGERKAMLSALKIEPDLFYSEEAKSNFLQPFRYINLSFGVHANGRPFILLPLNTRMIPPETGFSFANISRRIPDWWVPYLRKGDIQAYFHSQARKRRLSPQTVIVREILHNIDPQKYSTPEGTLYDSVVNRINSTLAAKDLPLLSDTELRIISEPGDYLRVEPSSLSDERYEFFIPPYFAVPIIHQMNWWLFDKILFPNGYKMHRDFGRMYFEVSAMKTELKAAMIDYVKNLIMKHVDLSMKVGEVTAPVRLSDAIRFDESQMTEPFEEPRTYDTKTVDDCLLWELPQPMIHVRNPAGEVIEIRPSELYDFAVSGKGMAFRTAPVLQEIKIAIIGPSKNYKTLENAKALISFNHEMLVTNEELAKLNEKSMTGQKLGMLAWKKNMENVFENLRKFFGNAKPKVEVVGLDDITVEAYCDAMQQKFASGFIAFIIILPSGKGRFRSIADQIYFSTYRLVAEWFVRGHRVVVKHHTPRSYTPGGGYYHVLFTDWASINNGLGGKTTQLKLESASSIFKDFTNPMFAAMDFATPSKNIIGAVLSCGPELDINVNLTEDRITRLSDASENLSQILLRQIDELKPDVVIFFKDSKITSMERKGFTLPYDNMNVPLVVVEALKSGGVSGFRLSEKSKAKGGSGVTFLSGVGLLTGNMEAHIFPAERKIPTRENRYGLQTAMRYRVDTARPADVARMFTIKEIANIATGLASTYSYYPEPQKAKMMEIHKKADIIAKLAAADLFDGLEGAKLPASLFD